MQVLEFVENLKAKIIDNSIIEYGDLLDRANNATDSTWQSIFAVYDKLTEQEKISFLNFIRLIKVNTLSAVLGVLDGSSYLSAHRETFILTSESDGEVLSGSLQDLFLEMEEDNNG
ncbi:hypothetical protein [uncultured Chitinophaga sp.]|uniref:hypothetical protein n=1 Tax=uncultured Chitinophaga sp. TaxID=339340 RepID=UPI0025F99BA1|nr:hypothetical protein [uncultured Chitinophaga sp.]